MDCIGFICDPDHAVFRPVAQRLAARGFDVEFFRPTDPITRADIEGLAAVVGAVVHPASLAALRYADAVGVPTWNGFAMVTALSARLVTLEALEAVGCRVPSVRFDGPAEGYTAGHRYAWDGAPSLDGAAPFYVETVGAASVDHRYYAVDDGRETHMRAMALRTAIEDDEPLLERTDVDVSLAASVRELLDVFGARAVAVDFTEGADGAFYALRATPTPTFAGAGMERRVADSVASLTTIGA
jgi:hypothetical protein